MQTRREYAVSLGLAKPGRGRMSSEAHSAINKALAEGMRFSDVRADSDSSKPVTSEQATKDSAPATFTGPTPDPIYNGGWYYWEGKKKVNISGNEICRKCMVSLDWHKCNLPVFPSLATNEMVRVMR